MSTKVRMLHAAGINTVIIVLSGNYLTFSDTTNEFLPGENKELLKRSEVN